MMCHLLPFAKLDSYLVDWEVGSICQIKMQPWQPTANTVAERGFQARQDTPL